MTYTLLSILIYLLVSAPATWFTGKVAHNNGEEFMKEIFEHNSALVKPVNNILLTCFYLMNAGFILMFLLQRVRIITIEGIIELLAFRIGIVLSALGVMHFINIAVLLLVHHFTEKKKREG